VWAAVTSARVSSGFSADDDRTEVAVDAEDLRHDQYSEVLAAIVGP
jgi:hypothetical protein